MAILHVKTPNGTTQTMDLTTINFHADANSVGGWCRMPNGFTIQWLSYTNGYIIPYGGQVDLPVGEIRYPIQFTGGGAFSVMITPWGSSPFIFVHGERGWDSWSAIGNLRIVAPPNCSGNIGFDVFAIGAT